MKSDAVSDVALGVLGACVIGLVGFLLFHRGSVSPAAPAPAMTIVRGWRSYAVHGHRMGPLRAPVTIVEFADFQCPFCRRMAVELQAIRKHYPKSVAIIFRQFPLTRLHPYAAQAAIAAECAANQASFESFYNKVYAMQDSLGVTSWARFASLAGAPDTVAFDQCLSDSEPVERIRADIAAGKRLGVSGTPTLLVDSVRIDGMTSEAMLDSLVGAALGSGA